MDIVYVLNDSVVESSTRLHSGDTLALIPALEGG
jgi:molybdopterin converting factor small subunit